MPAAELVSIIVATLMGLLLLLRQMSKTSTDLQKQLNDAYESRSVSENDITNLKRRQSELEADVIALKAQRKLDNATIKNLSENCKQINSREIRLWRIISGILSLSIIWYQGDPRR